MVPQGMEPEAPIKGETQPQMIPNAPCIESLLCPAAQPQQKPTLLPDYRRSNN
jgi:hypothetical protein